MALAAGIPAAAFVSERTQAFQAGRPRIAS